MSQPRPIPEDRLESWHRRLDALLSELRAQRFSGRLHLYLDLRDGDLMEGGREKSHPECWTEKVLTRV